MVEAVTGNNEQLDKDWVAIILTARQMGLSIADIRKLLRDFQAQSDPEWPLHVNSEA
ncbi:anti-repressor SinI family protein [Paenibacillus thiaminolyticus]|uniref:Anti-repressor SinI family protein n=1 Tax=Paenibacillus thiaminolyticus TaxID=49283 RepID=A0AAJ1LGC4_PANTH|nr:anti-repressor SinI family protein [Paenibacillus thiaminolyticus]MCY9534284.1 anti-repressor SinI family protein [Paenibacillus thiaminolyticus]MCY9602995.1 anti-repressor SinI family protein [Paenibacillus thiaminolyticus]MCY9608226.1 anti-repressor SinI family protein [Paenibacillus thiaminolyticus]MCY9611594.1 anti-repressor SinI family protein [Paenibacillus thiaminolyticus]MCY9618278.1 anti-repressor SinI family protein [Paenibacillus thiaminolyticus]